MFNKFNVEFEKNHTNIHFNQFYHQLSESKMYISAFDLFQNKREIHN